MDDNGANLLTYHRLISFKYNPHRCVIGQCGVVGLDLQSLAADVAADPLNRLMILVDERDRVFGGMAAVVTVFQRLFPLIFVR